MAEKTDKQSKYSTWESMRRTVTAPHQECMVTRWLEVRESRS